MAARLPLKITRPTSDRSIALKFLPPLHNLPQSRAVSAALAARFGPLDAFRNQRYELHRPSPGVVLALFRSRQAAQRILAAAPLKARLVVGAGRSGDGVLQCEITSTNGARVEHTGPEQDFGGEEVVPQPELGRSTQQDDWGLAGLMGLSRAEEGRYSRGPSEQKRSYSVAARAGLPQLKEQVLEFVVLAEPARVDLEAGVAKHPCHGPFDVHIRDGVAASVAARAPQRGLADLTLHRARLAWHAVGRQGRKAGLTGFSLWRLWEDAQKK